MAIDAAAGRIYWTNYGDGTIRAARLAGQGTVDILYGPPQGLAEPSGVAIDPPPDPPGAAGDFRCGSPCD